MDAVQREYDRFGPWTLELTDEDPLPRLFEGHVPRREAPLLGLKIPRHVERRDVRAGADLYDHVVLLYEDELVVLSRADAGVTTASCAIGDIRHLRMRRSLLRGEVHVGLPAGSMVVPFNTISEGLMQRLVELIRARYLSGSIPSVALPTPVATPDGLSFYFQQAVDVEARERAAMRLLACQATRPVAVAQGRVRRALFALADKRLLESTHASDGRELRVLSRGKAYAYRWESVYGVETTWFPLLRIRSVTWQPDPATATTTLVVGTGGGDGRYVFDAANPTLERYAAWLRTLPSLRTGAAAETRLAA